MAIIRKQYHGIKFPFTANNLNGFFLDLNSEVDEKIASEIAHVLLTPKRSRLRKPDFGTDLIKFIFNDNVEETLDAITAEAKESVKKYVPNAELTNLNVVYDEKEPHSVYVDLTFAYKRGGNVENNRMVIKI